MSINQEKLKIQSDIVSAWRDNDYNGVVIAPTGIGKAKILIDAIEEITSTRILHYPIIIGVNRAYLRDIGLPNEFNKWASNNVLKMLKAGMIQIECYQTLCKLSRNTYELALCDEFDSLITLEQIKFLENNTFQSLLALTATLPKEKRDISNTYYKVIYEMSLQEAQDKGLLNQIDILIHEVPLYDSCTYPIMVGKRSMSEVAYYKWINKQIQFYKDEINDRYRLMETSADLIATSRAKSELYGLKQLKEKYESHFAYPLNRMEVTYKLQSLTHYAAKLGTEILKDEANKVMFIARRTKSIDKLTKYGYYGAKANNDYLNWFNEGIIREIGAVGKIDRGISLVGLNHTIAHSFSSSEIDFCQKLLGRITRLKPSETATLHILISYYMEGNEKVYCQNKAWLDNFLDK